MRGSYSVALQCASAVDCDWQSDYYDTTSEVIREEGEGGLLTCPDCGRQSFERVSRIEVTH